MFLPALKQEKDRIIGHDRAASSEGLKNIVWEKRGHKISPRQLLW